MSGLRSEESGERKSGNTSGVERSAEREVAERDRTTELSESSVCVHIENLVCQYRLLIDRDRPNQYC